MFSPVLAANNNHMLDLLPNVYFISSLVHNEDAGRKKKKKEVLLLQELLTRGPDVPRRCPAPARSGCRLTSRCAVGSCVSPRLPQTQGVPVEDIRRGGAGTVPRIALLLPPPGTVRRTAERDDKVLTNLSPLLYKLSVSDGVRGTSSFSAQQNQRPRPTASEAHELLVSSTNGNPEVLVSSGSQKASDLQSSFMM